MKKRNLDQGKSLYKYRDKIFVECPNCSSIATITVQDIQYNYSISQSETISWHVAFIKKVKILFGRERFMVHLKNLVEIADTNGWKNTFIVLNFLLIFQRL